MFGVFTKQCRGFAYNAGMQRAWRVFGLVLMVCCSAWSASLLRAQDSEAPRTTKLSNGKILGEVPGSPRPTNNFPTAAAISPDGRFAVLLHGGYGAYASQGKQSLSVLNLETNELRDFPDDRLGNDAKQTYFLGMAFGLDGKHLYASMASLTDPLGKEKG